MSERIVVILVSVLGEIARGVLLGLAFYWLIQHVQFPSHV